MQGNDPDTPTNNSLHTSFFVWEKNPFLFQIVSRAAKPYTWSKLSSIQLDLVYLL